MAPLQHCAASCLRGAGKHPCKVLNTTIDTRNSEITLCLTLTPSYVTVKQLNLPPVPEPQPNLIHLAQ